MNVALSDERPASRRLASNMRALLLLWLAGVSLRLTILALPPVLNAVTAEFRLRGTDLGILTALPPLLFALAAVPGAALIGRFGAVPSLLAGLLITAFGAAARGFSGNVVALELATAVMCFGVAIMQPALPSLVRTWTPARVGLATATYTCGLLCGEVLPVLWPFAPDLPMIGAGWRGVLFQWSLPVLATAVVTAVFRPRAHQARRPSVARLWPNWRSTSIWPIALLLGAVNASYFGLNGFLPGWLSQSGRSDLIRSALLTLNVAQIPASLLLMVFIERLVFRRASYVVAGFAMLAGSVGLVMAPPTFAVAFAALAGFSMAWLLTLALALPPLLVDAEEVASLSAAVFTVSYGIAVITALATGLLQTIGVSRSTSILPIAASALVVIVTGTMIRRASARKAAATP